jgi:hypothetical protein
MPEGVTLRFCVGGANVKRGRLNTCTVNIDAIGGEARGSAHRYLSATPK